MDASGAIGTSSRPAAGERAHRGEHHEPPRERLEHVAARLRGERLVRTEDQPSTRPSKDHFGRPGMRTEAATIASTTAVAPTSGASTS